MEKLNEIYLGYKDSRVIEDNDAYSTKLGGTPVWFDDCKLAVDPTCTNCKEKVRLVVQLYAPLPQFSEQPRSLLIFCCHNKNCLGSWQVYRMQSTCSETLPSVDPLPQPAPAKSSLDFDFTTTFALTNNGNNDNTSAKTTSSAFDFSTPSTEADLEALLKLRDLSLQAHTNVGTDSAVIPVTEAPLAKKGKKKDPLHVEGTYKAHYLALDLEPEDAHIELTESERRLLRQYEEEEARLQQASKKGVLNMDDEDFQQEHYESASKSDKSLRKFQKRVARSPSQVLRYQWQGEPLWLTNQEPASIPRCACGQPRVFELQLMPALIQTLQPRPVHEWGVVAVYSCQASCHSAQPVQEFAHLQAAV